MREWRVGENRRGLAGAVVIGALLGLTGPFGTQNAFAPAVRYPFWMILALAGYATAAATQRLLSARLSDRTRTIRMFAIAAASAIPLTFVVAWAFGVVQSGRSYTPLQLLGLYPFVALVQLPIAWVASPDDPVTAAAPVEPPAAEPEYPADFLAKLPPTLRRDIVALEAEDHYLRVHTLHGSALVLMRLADAAALIDPRLGMRVHRSWWIARGSVRALEKGPGRPVARLIDDKSVPISRTYWQQARSFLAD